MPPIREAGRWSTAPGEWRSDFDEDSAALMLEFFGNEPLARRNGVARQASRRSAHKVVSTADLLRRGYRAVPGYADRRNYPAPTFAGRTSGRPGG